MQAIGAAIPKAAPAVVTRATLTLSQAKRLVEDKVPTVASKAVGRSSEEELFAHLPQKSPPRAPDARKGAARREPATAQKDSRPNYASPPRRLSKGRSSEARNEVGH